MARGVRSRQGAPPPTGVGIKQRDKENAARNYKTARAMGPDAGLGVMPRAKAALGLGSTRTDRSLMDTESPVRSSKGKVRS